MRRMDEKEAEKKLKNIRKRLKRLKERRAEYIGTLEKREKYKETVLKNRDRELIFSAVISGAISITVYLILYRFSAPEYLKLSTTVLLFFTLIFLMQMQNERYGKGMGEKYLKIIDCLIEELEKEEEDIVSKFPDADRWVPSVKPSLEKPGKDRLSLLIQLLFFILSPSITQGIPLLIYLGTIASMFVYTETKRSRELRIWEKECEERGKLVSLM
jgi:hypothetical protein